MKLAKFFKPSCEERISYMRYSESDIRDGAINRLIDTIISQLGSVKINRILIMYHPQDYPCNFGVMINYTEYKNGSNREPIPRVISAKCDKYQIQDTIDQTLKYIKDLGGKLINLDVVRLHDGDAYIFAQCYLKDHQVVIH